ncbi:MAG TPA: multicopper oxidase domain-containing protein [Candidatus Deferrimicrobiaceae bacterium]
MRTKRKNGSCSWLLSVPVLLLAASAAMAFYQTPATIRLFGTDLRGVGPGGIPVAAPDLAPATVTGVTHYTIDIKKFTDNVTPPSSGLGPTTFFGYDPVYPLGGGIQAQKHLGGIIVGEKGVPIQITFKNFLGTGSGKHILPNDPTIMGAMDGNFRTSTHLHGGLVPWVSDGGPMAWFGPDNVTGPSFLNNQVLNPFATAGEAEYYYPLNQSARFLWYHDHAFGITRLNAYAGVATALLVRDNFERSLQPAGLPPFIENSVLSATAVRELPLVIQDKIFVGADINLLDPTWATIVDNDATRPGSLWYAHVYERNRWKLAGNAGGASLKNPPPGDPSVIPEFFGDTMLVNGTTFPKKAVEPRRYRLRFLNACQARFLNLQFYVADNSLNGITLNPATGIPTNAPFAPKLYAAAAATPKVLQIGTEGGFLAKPALIPTNAPFNPVTMTGSMIVSPAERPDILVDFSGYEGKSIILYNDAAAPFPMGDPRNDYFPGWNVKGNPVNGLTPAGFGPNTRVLMRFDVGTVVTGAPDVPLAIDNTTDLTGGIDPKLVPWGSTAVPAGTFVRPLTLNETYDANGRLIQMLGTNIAPLSPSAGFGRAYLDNATEIVKAGTTEVWEIYNTTADVHPMHFHLVNVQVLNRQPFQVSSLYANGTPNFTGPITPPAPEEVGWKETVHMFPGTVTRIIMKFDVPPIVTSGGAVIPTPVSPRTGGFEYVWHCHILEHEEHDMMRPLVVS